MKIRTLLSLAALAALSSAQAAPSIYFGDSSGNALTSLDAPSVGSGFTVSVWYASDVALIDGEILLTYDTTTGSAGAGAASAGDVGAPVIQNPAAVLGPTLSGIGAGLGDSPDPRPFGLSVIGITGGGGGALPPTPGARLFDVRFANLGLTAGESATLSFYASSTATLYRTSFLDGAVNEVAPTVGSLRAQAVPEPGTVAVLGLGVVGMLRRRRSQP